MLLSDAACDQLGSAVPPLLQEAELNDSLADESADDTSWKKIAVMLEKQELSDSQDAIKALSVMFRQMDESTRMTLVDELLLASAMPE